MESFIWFNILVKNNGGMKQLISVIFHGCAVIEEQ